MFELSNAVGQRFTIEGLNDEMAYNYAKEWVEAGRPFGRKAMKWMKLMFGVEVKFLPNHWADDYATGRCGDGY